jgi:hypothetical protein
MNTKKYYSPSKGGFYLDEHRDLYERAGTWPTDLVEISKIDEEFVREAASRLQVVSLVKGKWKSAAPPVDLDAIWSRIQQIRDAHYAGGVQVGEHWFHTDLDSKVLYLSLKDSGRDMLDAGGALTDVITVAGYPVLWKTMDGTMVPMTIQLGNDIVAAAKQLQAQVFAVAEGYHEALLESKAPAKMDFTSGWPPMFAAT